MLSISGELIPLLEAPNERRRKVVGVASGLLLEEVARLSLSLSMMAFELWSLLSLGISQPPTPSMISIVSTVEKENSKWDGMASHTLIITINLRRIVWQTDKADTATRPV